MIRTLAIWLLKKALKKNREIVRELYLEQREGEINEMNPRTVRVKKGKIKYELLLFDEPGGTIRFNLGRHWGAIEGQLNVKQSA